MKERGKNINVRQRWKASKKKEGTGVWRGQGVMRRALVRVKEWRTKEIRADPGPAIMVAKVHSRPDYLTPGEVWLLDAVEGGARLACYAKTLKWVLTTPDRKERPVSEARMTRLTDGKALRVWMRSD